MQLHYNIRVYSVQAVANTNTTTIQFADDLASNNFIYLLVNIDSCLSKNLDFGNILQRKRCSSSTQIRFVCINVQALSRRSPIYTKIKPKIWLCM